MMVMPLRYGMSLRLSNKPNDFYAGSLKELKHLIQYDDKPNSDFKSPRVELYKISVTFRSKGIFQGISSLRGIRA